MVPISSLVIAALFTPAQSAAERYEPVFEELRHMTQGERVAPVRNVTLRRDAIRGNAIPKYVFSWRAEPAQGGHYTLQLRVRQEDVPEHFVMPVPVKIGFADETMYAYVRIKVTGPVTEVALDLPAEPTRVEFNPLESVLADVKEEEWE